MKKKILLISESMGGGLRKHVLQLIENLDSELFDIYFIHGTKNVDEEFMNKYDDILTKASVFPCVFFEREISPVLDVKSYFFISKIIKQIQPDIIHCHSSKAGVLGRLAAKFNKVSKVFYTPHAYSFLSYEFSTRKILFFTLLEKILSRAFTKKTFCVSKGEKESALSHHIDLESKFVVIYNGIPEKSFPRDNEIKDYLNLSPGKILVGNCARLSNQKNPELFLKIAKRAKFDKLDYYFIWIGSGDSFEKYKDMAKNEDNITFMGEKANSEELVSNFDVFLSTSSFEGLPYSLIEALRASVPIVATNVVGNNEIVVDKLNGFIFENTDVTDALSKIALALNLDKNEIYYTYIRNFTVEKMMKNITEEYLGCD